MAVMLTVLLVASPTDENQMLGMRTEVGTIFHLFTAAPSTTRFAVGASVALHFDRGVDLEAGGRLLFGERLPPSDLFDLFVAAFIAPTIGPWHPRAGVELGYSGAVGQVLGRKEMAPTSFDRMLADVSPFYIASVAAPLRFSFGSVGFDALVIKAGTPLSDVGRVVRLELTVLAFEWRI